MAAMIRSPVAPVIADTTSASLTFICSSAFCMWRVWLAAYRTSICRWRW
jgi:hypothetical protein